MALLACAAPGRLAAQAPGAVAAAPRRGAAAPDVRFLQHMIGHHAQALAMAALVPARTRRADVRAAAERIAASQADEIALMRRWLAAHGAAVPDSAGRDTAALAAAPQAAHAGHDSHAGHAAPADHAAMPGMLAPAELARLGTLRGPAFDRAFLAGMIRHHEGALAMVAELFAAPGAAQDPEVFRLASDVDADQRAEVARMRRMLRAPAAR